MKNILDLKRRKTVNDEGHQFQTTMFLLASIYFPDSVVVNFVKYPEEVHSKSKIKSSSLKRDRGEGRGAADLLRIKSKEQVPIL